MKLIFTILLLLLTKIGNAQITFQKTLGGPGVGAERGFAIRQTIDGGYIIADSTNSFGAGNTDVYLVKTDSSGNILWTKTFGGANAEFGYSVEQTTDSGFIVAGFTASFGAGSNDVYLIKTNSTGDTLWTRTYGGVSNDYASSVKQTPDGGYIIVGSTYSFGAGQYDLYLLKVDSTGNLVWSKAYGGTNPEYGQCAQPTNDGGYIITGFTYSFGGPDLYLIKTDSLGNVEWTKAFDGTGQNWGYSVQLTADGGYAIGGYVGSDVCLIKTDSLGNILWIKSYGGSNYDEGFSLEKTTDGGYILAGYTKSFGAGNFDIYLVKADSVGNCQWSKTYGGTNSDFGYDAHETADGGYIVVGYTNSYGIGSGDIYLIKTDATGNTGCNETSPATVTSIPSITISSTSTVVTSPATVMVRPATLVGSGGIETTLCSALGIPYLIRNNLISIYPNPTSSNLTFSFPTTFSPQQLILYNVNGAEVGRYNVPSNSNRMEVKLGEMAKGLYVARLVGDGVEGNVKFVVQ